MREMRRRSSVAMGGAVRLGMLAEGDMDDGEDGDEQVTPETQLVESSNSLTATADRNGSLPIAERGVP